MSSFVTSPTTCTPPCSERPSTATSPLQQYLAAQLRHLAEHRSISEVLDEVEAQHGGRVGLDTAVDDLDEERSAR